MVSMFYNYYVFCLLSCLHTNNPIAIIIFAEVEVAREAYIYFYPILVFMSQLFDEAVWPHTPDYLAMNTFGHQLQSLDWTYAAVTDPSVDHLYSQAWLDLGRYPVVLNIPDIPEQVCTI